MHKLSKPKIFGSIKTQLGLIGIEEKNNKITDLFWCQKTQETSSILLNLALKKFHSFCHS